MLPRVALRWFLVFFHFSVLTRSCRPCALKWAAYAVWYTLRHLPHLRVRAPRPTSCSLCQVGEEASFVKRKTSQGTRDEKRECFEICWYPPFDRLAMIVLRVYSNWLEIGIDIASRTSLTSDVIKVQIPHINEYFINTRYNEPLNVNLE